ncbi:MAG: response regulator [Myxococcota bacterium]
MSSAGDTVAVCPLQQSEATWRGESLFGAFAAETPARNLSGAGVSFFEVAAVDRRSRVLVVDDEPLVGRGLRRVLARAGYDATVVDSAPEAWACVARDPHYAVVFLDCHLVGHTGPECLRGLRRRGLVSPVVFLSGGLQNIDLEAVEDTSPVRFLPKPVLAEELLETLRACLEGPDVRVNRRPGT